MRALVGFLMALASSPGGGTDVTGESAAFVEMTAPRATYALQEPIRLTVRFGIEKRFLADNLIQIFGQRLDVPMALEAPAFGALPGTFFSRVASEPGGERRRTFVLNGAKAEATLEADRVIGGREFTVLSIERSVLPTAPGELAVGGPVLRFSYATRFEEDFFNGRVPAEKRDTVLTGASLTLRIASWPEIGRPPANVFGGAVGRFTIAAAAAPREIEVGKSLKLTLRIEGEGNCELFEAPPLDAALQGFHVYGKIEEKSATRRVVTYDVAPLRADVTAVPPIEFAFFEPGGEAEGMGAYRTIETEAIPLVVRPGPGGEPARTAAPSGSAPGVDDIYDLKTIATAEDDAAPLSRPLLVIAIALPFLLALSLHLFLRARERERSDPSRARARAAATVFRESVAPNEASISVADAFAEYLAARLHCPAAAVIAPGLATRLEAAGIPAATALRAAQLLETLVAARYGGGAPQGSVESAHALMAELEAGFSR